MPSSLSVKILHHESCSENEKGDAFILVKLNLTFQFFNYHPTLSPFKRLEGGTQGKLLPQLELYSYLKL